MACKLYGVVELTSPWFCFQHTSDENLKKVENGCQSGVVRWLALSLPRADN